MWSGEKGLPPQEFKDLPLEKSWGDGMRQEKAKTLNRSSHGDT